MCDRKLIAYKNNSDTSLSDVREVSCRYILENSITDEYRFKSGISSVDL